MAVTSPSDALTPLLDACDMCGVDLTSTELCIRCRKAGYCSKDCQTKDWPLHKQECGQVKYNECFRLCLCVDSHTMIMIRALHWPLTNLLDRRLCSESIRTMQRNPIFTDPHTLVFIWLDAGRAGLHRTVTDATIVKTLDVLQNHGFDFDRRSGMPLTLFESVFQSHIPYVSANAATAGTLLLSQGSFSSITTDRFDRNVIFIEQMKYYYTQTITYFHVQCGLLPELAALTASYLFTTSILSLIKQQNIISVKP